MELVKFEDLSAEEQEELITQFQAQQEAIEALQGGDYELVQELHNIAIGRELY